MYIKIFKYNFPCARLEDVLWSAGKAPFFLSSPIDKG